MTRLTIDQVIEAVESDEYIGFCLSCGEEAYGVEPDARQYKCESCGEYRVFGAEEILIMGAFDDDQKKQRIPSIGQLLTGKGQSPGIRPYAKEVLMHSGILVHAGVMLIRIHEKIESIVSDGAKLCADQLIMIWNEPHEDSEEIVVGKFVTINHIHCRRMIGKKTKEHSATVNELYRRAAEKHGNVYRWFRSVAIGDEETNTPISIIGFNTAGERAAIIACVRQ